MRGGLIGTPHARVAEPHDQDAQRLVLDTGDDAVVAHAVLPEFAQLGALEGFADAARVIERGHASIQEGQDVPPPVRLQRPAGACAANSTPLGAAPPDRSRDPAPLLMLAKK